MKIKTSELSGQALDFIVAQLEQALDDKLTVIRRENHVGQKVWREVERDSAPNFEWWAPSRIWKQGGPIIERERIDLQAKINAGSDIDEWLATVGIGAKQRRRYSRTPLIAAMRCYVASKLGNEVEIDDELLEHLL